MGSLRSSAPTHDLGHLAAESLAALFNTLLARTARRAVFGLPVVVDLLEVVLEGGERHHVGPSPLAVRLDGVVVRLDPGPLGLGGRALDRIRHHVLAGHGIPPCRWPCPPHGGNVTSSWSFYL